MVRVHYEPIRFVSRRAAQFQCCVLLGTRPILNFVLPFKTHGTGMAQLRHIQGTETSCM
jgi:hypothetical protein